MNIQDKIQEIRSKPEHIRIRYVYGCVGFSMIIVFILWLFSVQVSFQDLTDKMEQEKGVLQQDAKNENASTVDETGDWAQEK